MSAAVTSLPDRPLDERSLDERPLDEVEDDLVACASRLAAGEAEFLRLLGEFDARSGWVGDGILSLEHWLSWRCGMTRGTARDRIRVARALRSLPKIAAAMSEGRVSYSKVRAMARAATPATEHVLLETAMQCTAGQLERHVRALRYCVTVEEREAAMRAAKAAADADPSDEATADEATADEATVDDSPSSEPQPDEPQSDEPQSEEPPLITGHPYGVSWHFDSAGDLVFSGRLAADQGAELLAALDLAARAATETSASDVSAETPDSSVSAETTKPLVMRTEELGRFSTKTWQTLAQAATRELVAGRGAPSLAPVAEVIVHVEADELLDLGTNSGTDTTADTTADTTPDTTPPRPRRHLADGPALGREVLARLVCDGGIRLQTHGSDGQTLDLGRRRHPTGRMAKVLLHRDQGCRFPSCGRLRYLHAHHVLAWSEGGLTVLDNMILLCGEHHRLLHREAFGIEALGNQRFRFVRADGSELMTVPDLAPDTDGACAEASVVSLAELYASVDRDAIVPNWTGDSLADQDLRIVRYLESRESAEEIASARAA